MLDLVALHVVFRITAFDFVFCVVAFILVRLIVGCRFGLFWVI